MKITKVEAIPVSIPCKQFRDAYGLYSQVRHVLVKIHVDEGTIGVGEASLIDPSFYGETQESIALVIDKYIWPIIKKENPMNIEKINSKIDQRIAGNACAKSAIDMALYDLVGKIHEVPVYAILGGLFKDRVPVGFEISIKSAKEVAKQATMLMESGAKAIKLHVGTNPKEDVHAIRTLRDSVGNDVILRADANGAYNTSQAIKVIRKVRKCELEYFEQPVTRGNIDGLIEIKRSVDTPIAVDESVWTPSDAMNICARRAADVINIKIVRVGGLNNAKKIAAIAEASYLPCVVGCEVEFGVGTAAKVHLAASTKNFTCIGEFSEFILLNDNVLKDPIKIEDGFIKTPNKSGLGIELDDTKVSLYKNGTKKKI